MSQSLVMVVDDEPDIRELVREILEDEGYAVVVAEDVRSAREAISEKLPDLVLLDIWMPDQDGVSLLKEWSEEGGLKFPVVMISGHGTVETAVEATRLGAVDFIEKPLSLARLLLSVEKAIDGFNQTQVFHGKGKERDVPKLVGNSQYVNELRETLEKSAANDTGVLVQGERATGKMLLAQHVHYASSRASMPFIVLRCDSLSDANAVHEMLGDDNNDGYLESANGGTLCLIDVEELPASCQALLSDVLDKGIIDKVAGKPVTFDARVIATTTLDLQSQLSQGLFNEALYYQLAVLQIYTRPLRDHREDVPLLLNYYVDRPVSYTHLTLPTTPYV